ncbi:hypothetical protein ACRALDRAFT_1094698 [Sodiomyces alcalophilus JCM 7366]|uniref:uncharacterized protein n=1 Tax=Sodiomyces alcalophilus JCM 7366 TaxID=591952 RepID=UPI0039B6C1A0
MVGSRDGYRYIHGMQFRQAVHQGSITEMKTIRFTASLRTEQRNLGRRDASPGHFPMKNPLPPNGRSLLVGSTLRWRMVKGLAAGTRGFTVHDLILPNINSAHISTRTHQYGRSFRTSSHFCEFSMSTTNINSEDALGSVNWDGLVQYAIDRKAQRDANSGPTDCRLSFETDCNNIAAVPLISMEFIPGDTAMDSFGQISMLPMAYIQVQMSAIRFPQIGSIIKHPDGTYELEASRNCHGNYSPLSTADASSSAHDAKMLRRHIRHMLGVHGKRFPSNGLGGLGVHSYAAILSFRVQYTTPPLQTGIAHETDSSVIFVKGGLPRNWLPF